MRARPLTQSHFSSSNLARQTEHDARREIAWMSTGNGVQLVSIQPMEVSEWSVTVQYFCVEKRLRVWLTISQIVIMDIP